MRNRSSFEKIEILFFLAVAAGCLITLVHAALAVRLPFQLDFGEGPLLAVAARMAQGLGCYAEPASAPYAIVPYGPVPYDLVALCVKLFGVSFTVPRILVAASGVWCAALIALLVRHWGGSLKTGVAFGLLYLARPVVRDWLSLLRVDFIGLAFSLTGLYLFVKSRRRWYLAVPFFVAALFSKFTFVAAPVACFLYAVLGRSGGKAVRFAGSILVLGTLAFLWTQRASGGWFAFHTIWSNADQAYSLSPKVLMLADQLQSECLLVVLALFLAYWARSRPRFWLPLIYLGFSFLTLPAIGKIGSNSNYFLEWEAGLCLCAGLTYQLLREKAERLGVRSALVPALLTVLVAIYLHGPNPSRGPDPRAEFSECRQAYEYVRSHPGARILSENVGALVVAGKRPLVLEPFLWTREVEHHGWPGADEIVDLIRNRQIDLIVLGSWGTYSERWPVAVEDAVQRNYKVVKTFSCQDALVAYEPRPFALAPQAGNTAELSQGR